MSARIAGCGIAYLSQKRTAVFSTPGKAHVEHFSVEISQPLEAWYLAVQYGARRRKADPFYYARQRHNKGYASCAH